MCRKTLEEIAKDNALECDICKTERRRRKLVVTDAEDSRQKTHVFINAPAIFPNNDIKYDANKKRSVVWCRWNQRSIAWSNTGLIGFQIKGKKVLIVM